LVSAKPETLRFLPGALGLTLHSLGFVDIGQQVFTFGIISSLPLLQQRCDGIVVELEPGLGDADVVVHALIARIECRHSLVFFERFGIAMLIQQSGCQPGMSIGAAGVDSEQLGKRVLRL
jgi:hypothetical protein